MTRYNPGSNSKSKKHRVRQSSVDRNGPISLSDVIVSRLSWMSLVQEFSSKLILEVFGAGGAIWGFSDVCGFRTTEDDSMHFWRSTALFVAVIFGLRWFLQLKSAWIQLNEEKQDTAGRTSSDINYRTILAEKSPIGIQLSSFFGDDFENDMVGDEMALPSSSDEEESFHETTALASSPRSPLA